MMLPMTVAASVPETTYALTGAALGPFSTVFPYEVAGDVQVWLAVGTAEPVLLSLGPGYGLAGADPLTGGGLVTLDPSVLATANWPASSMLCLRRATASGQPAGPFGDGAGFSPAAVEAAIDHVERQAQDVAATLRRTLVVPLGEVAFALPRGIDRAGKLAMFGSVSPYPLLAADQTLEDFEAEIAAAALTQLQASLPGASAFYPTYAAANAAVGGLAANTVVEVYADETAQDETTRYRVVSGALAYRIVLTSRAREITPLDYGWVDGGALLTQAEIDANPQWIGKPVIVAGVPTTRTVQWAITDMKGHAAMQEAANAALHSTSIPATPSVQGTVVPNNVAGVTKRNRPLRVPRGDTYLADTLLMVGDAVILRADGRLVSRLCVVTDADKPGILCDSATFSRWGDFGIVGLLPNHQALVDFDHTGAFGPALSTQQNIFDGLAITANSSSCYRGLRYNRIASSGGQGSECTYFAPFIAGFDLAGIEDGGFNALNHSIFGGDLQLNNKDGVLVNGGWAQLTGVSMESQGRPYNQTPNYTPHTTDGADLHVRAQAGAGALSGMTNCRSEGDLMLKSPYFTAATRAVVVSAGLYGDSRSNLRTTGMVFKEGARGRCYMVVNEGTKTGCTSEYLPMPAGIVGQALTVLTGFSGLPTAGAGLVGLVFQNRYPSNITYFEDILANTATTITIAVPVGGAHQLGTKYKISGKSAASDPAWDSSTEGRKVTGGTGEGFTGLAGSNVVTIGSGDLAYVDAGGYVYVNGGHTLTEGDYSFTVGLAAKVLSIAGNDLTLNRQLSNDVTEATGYCCLAAQVIADGDTALFDYAHSAFETGGELISCASNFGVVRNASLIFNYIPNVDSHGGGTRTDWNRTPGNGQGISFNWLGGPLGLGTPLMSRPADGAANVFDLSASFPDAKPSMQKLAITGNATITCGTVPAAGVTLDLVVSSTGGTYTVAGGSGVRMLGTDTVANTKTRIWQFLSDGTNLLQRCLPGPSL